MVLWSNLILPMVLVPLALMIALLGVSAMVFQALNESLLILQKNYKYLVQAFLDIEFFLQKVLAGMAAKSALPVRPLLIPASDGE